MPPIASAAEDFTYLLCADAPIGNPRTPYGQARHYCGSTNDLHRRINKEHRRALPTYTKRGTVRKNKKALRGSRLCAAWNAKRITWRVAQVWAGRSWEKRLKATHKLAKYCPFCTGRLPRSARWPGQIPPPCNVPIPDELLY